jgi:hypothetical protein
LYLRFKPDHTVKYPGFGELPTAWELKQKAALGLKAPQSNIPSTWELKKEAALSMASSKRAGSRSRSPKKD